MKRLNAHVLILAIELSKQANLLSNDGKLNDAQKMVGQ